MMSFALAVSCTPGSSTTMRSSPCCWITGSDTPSWLTRLCSVLMFCFSALSCTALIACGRNVATSLTPVPSGWLATTVSGMPSSSSGRAAVAAFGSVNWISIALPTRAMPLVRMFLSRSRVRASPANASIRFDSAVFMSTCIRKWTPPRRSRPRYIGSAWMAVSQRGDAATRFSATT